MHTGPPSEAEQLPPAQLMRVLLDTAPNGLLIARADGTLLHMNRHARNLLDWSGTDGRQRLAELFKSPEGALQARAQAAEQESPETRGMIEPLLLQATRADGTSFPVEASLTPVDSEDSRFLMLAFSDVTRRLELEARLEQRNRDLEQFAHVASHDLQEPLRMVTSYCQLLERRYAPQLDDRARGYIHHAVDGATRMRALIEGLLDYARIGLSPAIRTRADPRRLAVQVVHDVEAQTSSAGATVELGDFPDEVWVDPVGFRQVLQNLVSNSLKFRSSAPPRIILTSLIHLNECEFLVEDNGIGIAPGDQERVFHMFQRLHSREDYEGSGIGLALCRRIVESHGGRISIESGSSGGTRVRFTIPHSRP